MAITLRYSHFFCNSFMIIKPVINKRWGSVIVEITLGVGVFYVYCFLKNIN
jgi:hypothetical protein